MLATFLKEMRAARVVQSSHALSSLGSGWSAGEAGALEREFNFDDFIQASNFLNRYSAICAKLNHTPEWSNVYNKVTVRLHNAEFNGVTSKEIQIGQYLNTVSTATLNHDIDEVLPFTQITERAGVAVESITNDQDQPTSLFQIDDTKQQRRQLRITN